MVPVSASLSCVSREFLRSLRPNTTAKTITGGMAPNMMSVSRPEVVAMRMMPPMSNRDCRKNCGTDMMSVDSICVRSAEMRLFNSPTRRWPKNDIGRQISRA